MHKLAFLAALPACVSTPIYEPAPTTEPTPIGVNECRGSDCPYVGTNIYPMYTDEVEAHIMPLALRGVYEFHWQAFGAQTATTELNPNLAVVDRVENVEGAMRVRGIASGVGRLTVTGHVPYRDTEVYSTDWMDLDVLPVDRVQFDLPSYQPLDAPVAPVVAGTKVTFAVRLLAGGREVADATMVSDRGSRATWNTFSLDQIALGQHQITVRADSLTQATTLNFEATDRIDEIRTSDVRRPTPSYYHLVCAHAFTGGREIYTTWTKAVNYATGWIPTAAGNCLEVVPGTKNIARVSFTAADGKTVQIDVPQ